MIKIKRNWIWAKNICLIGVIFWFVETIIFLCLYGWHLRAINKAEQICDNISGAIILAGLAVIIGVIFKVIDYLLTEKK